MESVVVGGFDGHSDFLDGARLIVTPGPSEFHGRLGFHLCFDEVVAGQTDRLAALGGSDVIQTVLLDRHCGTVHILRLSFQLGTGLVVDHDQAVFHRLIGEDFESRL